MSSDVEEFQCTLLGTVEVTRHMSPLDRDERLRMAKICHTAIVKKAIAVRDRSWLLRPQHYSERVSLEMDLIDEEIALYNGEYLMCQHPIEMITAMVTLEDSNKHLVYIGHCSKDERRLAVVLSFNSYSEAKSLVKKYRKIKRKTSPGENTDLSDALEETLTISQNNEEKYINDNEEDNTDEYINDDNEKNPNIYANPTIEMNVAPELPPRNKSHKKVPNDPTKNKNKVYESGPPPIPTTPKPHKPKKEEDNYESENYENNTEKKCTDDEYVNDDSEESIYEDPESQNKGQTSSMQLPPRNKSDDKMKTESSKKGQKGGLFRKLNIGQKKDKSATKEVVRDIQIVKNTISKTKTKHEPIQKDSVRRPLPALPGEKANIAKDESDDNDSIYEEIGEAAVGQNRVYYMKPNNN